jgi:hypothetical protein
MAPLQIGGFHPRERHAQWAGTARSRTAGSPMRRPIGMVGMVYVNSS